MKKSIIIKKIIIGLMVFLCIILIIFNYSEAFVETNFSDFEKEKVNGLDTSAIENASGVVMDIMRVISVTIAMVMLLVISMKYMLASPGDRADIKKHAVAYVVGAFLLFGLTGILTAITNFAEQISAPSASK